MYIYSPDIYIYIYYILPFGHSSSESSSLNSRDPNPYSPKPLGALTQRGSETWGTLPLGPQP